MWLQNKVYENQGKNMTPGKLHKQSVFTKTYLENLAIYYS